jgi:soluble lytic murein transglycosylase-like protein
MELAALDTERPTRQDSARRKERAMTASGRVAQAVRTFASDVADGFFEITHNGLAFVGVAVVLALAVLLARPDLRHEGESRLMTWLKERQVAALGMVPELSAIDRATAADPGDLPKQQAAIAYWLSRKYRVAPEPLSALVAEAYEAGQKAKLDPTLILAVMAVESGFNPFAQSPVGAQGLMQVMTRVHTDKYALFGGKLAAFDPVSNLRVGVKVLQECIQRAGSLQEGLKHYVGAAMLPDDGGYADKVLAEHARLQQVAAGKNVPFAPAAPLRAVAPGATPEPVAAPADPEKLARL